MDNQSITLFVCLIVLMPIMPAYILYKYLPSRAVVKGPFKGFDVQLTGAFGGYFIVMLSIIAFITAASIGTQKYELWSVVGRIEIDQSNSAADLKDVLVTISPPEQQMFPDGRFEIKKIPLMKESGVETPALIIQKKGFEPATVHLEDKKPNFASINYSISRDSKGKKIVINDAIVLRIERPYTPNNAVAPSLVVTGNTTTP